MTDLEIQSLKDLNKLRSAPRLNHATRHLLLEELSIYIKDSDWCTIGIMASSSEIAIFQLQQIESFFNWSNLKVKSTPKGNGPVFLKANQNTNDVYIRIEHGLGEGILLSCQSNDPQT